MSNDTIKVAIRVRQLLEREHTAGLKNYWTVKDNSICLNDNEIYNRKAQAYSFDRVFDETSVTVDIFDEICKPIVDSAVDGFNGTIFAYGQSSSGKTFTMSGNRVQPGIISLAVDEIFSIITSIPDMEFLIRVGYMEVYNEKVTDLLNPGDNLVKLQEDTDRNIQVVGLTEECVNNIVSVKNVLKRGDAKRHTAETKQNDRSSRSHCILRFVIESRQVGHEDDAVKISQLYFVDLAGSEKANDNSGDRFREGCAINKSLFTLGMVIRKLSGDSSMQHMSFRDSKLTRILQNSIGGNSKTAIICTISPAHVDETDSTLKFASSAKIIQNRPHVNEVMSDAAMMKSYRLQIKKLEQQIQLMSSTGINMEKAELEKRLKEKEDAERRQSEIITKYRTMIVTSGSGVNIDEPVKKIRRQTWCPGKAKRELGTIAEISPQQISAVRDSNKMTSMIEEEDVNSNDNNTFGVEQSFRTGNCLADETIETNPMMKDYFELEDKYEFLVEVLKKKEKELHDLQVYNKTEHECDLEMIMELQKEMSIMKASVPWLEEELMKTQQERNALRQKVEDMNMKLNAVENGSGITKISAQLSESKNKVLEMENELLLQKSKSDFHDEQKKKQMEICINMLEEQGLTFDTINARLSADGQTTNANDILAELKMNHDEIANLKNEKNLLILSLEEEKNRCVELFEKFNAEVDNHKARHLQELNEANTEIKIYQEILAEEKETMQRYERDFLNIKSEKETLMHTYEDRIASLQAQLEKFTSDEMLRMKTYLECPEKYEPKLLDSQTHIDRCFKFEKDQSEENYKTVDEVVSQELSEISETSKLVELNDKVALFSQCKSYSSKECQTEKSIKCVSFDYVSEIEQQKERYEAQITALTEERDAANRTNHLKEIDYDVSFSQCDDKFTCALNDDDQSEKTIDIRAEDGLDLHSELCQAEMQMSDKSAEEIKILKAKLTQGRDAFDQQKKKHEVVMKELQEEMHTIVLQLKQLSKKIETLQALNAKLEKNKEELSNALEQKEKNVLSLEDTILGLRNDIGHVEDENKHYHSKINELERNITIGKGMLTNRDDKIKELKNELDLQKETLTIEFENKMVNLKDDLSDLEAKMSLQEEDLRQAKEKIAEMEKYECQFSDKIINLELDIEALNEKEETLTKLCTEYEEKIVTLEAEVESATARCSELEAKCANNFNIIDSEKTDLDLTVNNQIDVNDIQSIYKEQVHELEIQRQQTPQDSEELENMKKELLNDSNKISERLENASKTIHKMEKEKCDMERENAALVHQLKEMGEEAKVSRENVLSFENTILELRKNIGRVEDENQQYSNRIHEFEKNITIGKGMLANRDDNIKELRNELDLQKEIEFENKMVSMKDYLSDLEAKISLQEEDLRHAKEKIAEMETYECQSSDKIINLELDIEALNEKAETLTKVCTEYEEKIVTLEAEVESATVRSNEAESKKISEKLENAVKTIHEMEKEKCDIEREKAELIHQLKEMGEESKVSRENVLFFENTISELRKDIGRIEDENQQYSNRIHELEKNITIGKGMLANRDDNIKELRNELDLQKETLTIEFENKMVSMKDYLSDLEAKMSLQEDLRQAKEKIAEMETYKCQSSDKIINLELDIEALNEKAETLTKVCTEYEEKIVTLEAEVESATVRCNEAESKKISEKLENAVKTIHEMEKEKCDIEREKAELIHQLKEMGEESKVSRENVLSFENTISELRKDIGRVEDENQQYSNRIHELEKNITIGKGMLANRDDNIKELRNELDLQKETLTIEFENKMVSMKDYLSDLEAKMSLQEEDLRQAKEKIAEMETYKCQSSDKIINLELDIEALNEKAETLTKVCTEYEEKIVALEAEVESATVRSNEAESKKISEKLENAVKTIHEMEKEKCDIEREKAELIHQLKEMGEEAKVSRENVLSFENTISELRKDIGRLEDENQQYSNRIHELEKNITIGKGMLANRDDNIKELRNELDLQKETLTIEFENKMVSMKDYLSDLEAKMSLQEEDLRQAKEKIAEMEMYKCQSSDKIINLELDIEALNEKAETLTKVCTEYEEKIVALEAEVESATVRCNEAESKKISEKLENAVKTIHEMEKEKCDIEREKAELIHQLKEMGEEAKASRENVLSFENTISELRKDIGRVEDENQQYSNRIHEFEKNITIGKGMLANRDDNIKKLRNELDLQKETLTIEFENKMVSMKDYLSDLEAKMSLQEEDLRQAKEKITEMVTYKCQSSDKIINLELDIEALNEKAETLTKVCTEYEEKIVTLEAEVESATVRCNEAESKISEKLENAVKTIHEMEKEKCDIECEKAELIHQLKEMGEEAKVLRENVLSFENTISELRKDIGRVEDENQQYSNRIHELEKNITIRKGMLANRDDNIKELRNELDLQKETLTIEFENKMVSMKDYLSDLEAKMSLQEEDLRQAKEKIAEMETYKCQSSDKIINLELDIEALNEKAETLTKVCTEYEEKIVTLEAEVESATVRCNEAESKKISEKLENAVKTIHEMEKEKCDIEREKAELIHQLKEMGEEAKVSRENVLSFENTISELRKDIGRVEDENQQYSNRIHELEKNITIGKGMLANRDDNIKELRNELDLQKETLTIEFENKMVSMKDYLSDLEAKMSLQEEDLRQAKEKIAEMETYECQSSDKIINLELDIEALNEKAETLTKVCTEYEEKIVALEAEVESATVRSNEADSNKISEKLENAIKTIHEMEKEKCDIEREKAELIHQLKEMGEEAKVSREALDQLKKEMESLEEDKYQLEHHLHPCAIRYHSLPENFIWEEKWQEFVREEKKKRLQLICNVRALKREVEHEKERQRNALDEALQIVMEKEIRAPIIMELREKYEKAEDDANALNTKLRQECKVTKELREKLAQLEAIVSIKNVPAVDCMKEEHPCKYKMESFSAKLRLTEAEEQHTKKVSQYEETILQYDLRISKLKNENRRLQSNMDTTFDGRMSKQPMLEERKEQKMSSAFKQDFPTESSSLSTGITSTTGGVVEHIKVCMIESENKLLKKEVEKLKKKIAKVADFEKEYVNVKEELSRMRKKLGQTDEIEKENLMLKEQINSSKLHNTISSGYQDHPPPTSGSVFQRSIFSKPLGEMMLTSEDPPTSEPQSCVMKASKLEPHYRFPDLDPSSRKDKWKDNDNCKPS